MIHPQSVNIYDSKEYLNQLLEDIEEEKVPILRTASASSLIYCHRHQSDSPQEIDNEQRSKVPQESAIGGPYDTLDEPSINVMSSHLR